MIFYQIHPLFNSGQPSPTILNDRYTIDENSFSLFISNVEAADAVSDYQCVLGVVDPVQNQAFPYTRTQNANIPLSISSESFLPCCASYLLSLSLSLSQELLHSLKSLHQ